MTETRHDALWRRVEAHLDARTDPFQDAALARELRAVPEAEHATRRVLARLGALRQAGCSATAVSERPVGMPGTPGTTLAPPSVARTRERNSPRVAALAACAAGVAAAAALIAHVRDAEVPRGAPPIGGTAIAALDARPELGVIYSAHVEFEHTIPPPPRVALVIHEQRHVVGWNLSGNER